MKIRQLTNDEFQAFIKNDSFESIYQTLAYAFVMNKQKMDSFFIGMVDENNAIVAASLILVEKLFGFKYAYAPRGFLIDYKDEALVTTFTKLLRKYLGKLDIMAIKLCPMVIRYTHDTNNHLTIKDNNFDTIFQMLNKLDYYHLGFNQRFEALKPRFEAILNLNAPYYELFQNMRKNTRTKIRSAEKKGIEIHRGTREHLPYLYLQTQKKYPRDLKYFTDCYDYYSKTDQIAFYYAKLNTRQYLSYCQSLYQSQEQICQTLNQQVIGTSVKNQTNLLNQKIKADNELEVRKKNLMKATILLKDHPEGIVLASTLIVENQKEIHLLMDGYDRSLKELNAKHLLLWKLIHTYSEKGYQTFNLGGIIDPNLQDKKYQGLNEFKLGFGAKAIEYIGDLELITNKPLYYMYRQSSPIRNILKK